MRGVVIAAAGSGKRFGGNKLDLKLGKRALWEHVCAAAVEAVGADAVVMAVSPDEIDDYAARTQVKLCAGGSSRARSVAAALHALPEKVTMVAVLDAARPFQTAALITQCFDLAETRRCACVCCGRITDTIKRVENGEIVATLNRDALAAAQTPQVFERKKLEKAYCAAFDAGLEMTDDAAVYALSGAKIIPFINDKPNIKITYAYDYHIALTLYGDDNV